MGLKDEVNLAPQVGEFYWRNSVFLKAVHNFFFNSGAWITGLKIKANLPEKYLHSAYNYG